MKAVYIFFGFATVAVGTYFAIKIGNILIHGMRKRIARINQDRQNKKSIRGY
jgi:hypothetical protein